LQTAPAFLQTRRVQSDCAAFRKSVRAGRAGSAGKFLRRFFDDGAFVAYIDAGRQAKTSLARPPA
jgi:hypothetical protein